jgi:hypothetical protein
MFGGVGLDIVFPLEMIQQDPLLFQRGKRRYLPSVTSIPACVFLFPLFGVAMMLGAAPFPVVTIFGYLVVPLELLAADNEYANVPAKS